MELLTSLLSELFHFLRLKRFPLAEAESRFGMNENYHVTAIAIVYARIAGNKVMF